MTRPPRRTLARRTLVARLFLAVACTIGATASLTPSRLRADEAAKGKGVVENEELFKIPASGADEIQEFMKNLAQTAPEGESAPFARAPERWRQPERTLWGQRQ